MPSATRSACPDYIRVRLGLRGQGSQDDAELTITPESDALREQVAEHGRRLQALEDDLARRHRGDAA